MKASVILPTFNRSSVLRRTLLSIFSESFDYEVVVVDDGSTDDTPDVLKQFPVKTITLPRKTEWRNPSAAVNVGCRAATGDILIPHADDVSHGPQTIEMLCAAMRPGIFVLGSVLDAIPGDDGWAMADGWIVHGTHARNVWTYLGSVWREDVYRVGGWDERFISFGSDDVWFSDCLIYGRGLDPVWEDSIIGYHQHHERNARDWGTSYNLYQSLVDAGNYWTETAPWPPYTDPPTNARLPLRPEPPKQHEPIEDRNRRLRAIRRAKIR